MALVVSRRSTLSRLCSKASCLMMSSVYSEACLNIFEFLRLAGPLTLTFRGFGGAEVSTSEELAAGVSKVSVFRSRRPHQEHFPQNTEYSPHLWHNSVICEGSK